MHTYIITFRGVVLYEAVLLLLLSLPPLGRYASGGRARMQQSLTWGSYGVSRALALHHERGRLRRPWTWRPAIRSGMRCDCQCRGQGGPSRARLGRRTSAPHQVTQILYKFISIMYCIHFNMYSYFTSKGTVHGDGRYAVASKLPHLKFPT